MRKRSGFTLIELLVVIAIIAVLAAILFPVFSQAREKARQSACLSNLHQLGTAISLYRQDWEEFYFHIAPTRPTWKDHLLPYLHSKDVYLCPSNPVGWNSPQDFWGPKASARSGDSTGRFPISYASVGDEEELIYNFEGSDSLDAAPDPTHFVWLSETRSPEVWINPYLDFAAIPPLMHGKIHCHGKQINLLFSDGHVKGLRAIQTFQPVDLWERTTVPRIPTNLVFNGMAREYR
jgi:prepilin-type N-terminal cleavage/methylation domain-containing protein/prepilin-type processing-associated H-X9-DG protein